MDSTMKPPASTEWRQPEVQKTAPAWRSKTAICNTCSKEFVKRQASKPTRFCSRRCANRTLGMQARVDLAERFWNLVDQSGECWEWQGSTIPAGYGQVAISGELTRQLAHRVSWLLNRGPIPDGVLVLHHCDNKKCVRPEHLYLGSHKDNSRDAVERNLIRRNPRRGEANRNARLTWAAVDEIRTSTGTTAGLAVKFSVSERAISLVRQGKSWVRR